MRVILRSLRNARDAALVADRHSPRDDSLPAQWGDNTGRLTRLADIADAEEGQPSMFARLCWTVRVSGSPGGRTRSQRMAVSRSRSTASPTRPTE